VGLGHGPRFCTYDEPTPTSTPPFEFRNSPEQSGGFGTNADDDMAAMMLPFSDASCGLHSTYAHAGT